jgi:hypothetical protein
MMFDTCNWKSGRSAWSALALPLAIAGLGCATAPADDEGNSNTGNFMPPPATGGGGAGTAPPVTNAGRGGTTGGQAGTTGVVSGGAGAGAGGAGAGGTGDVTVGGMGGMAAGGTGGAGGAAGAAGAAGSGVPSMSSCLDGITSFAAAGPFTFTMETAGSVKMWVPDVPAGCKVPVIHLANGTGGTCGTYRAVHERFASHGFIATCYENANTGAGTQGLMALETAKMMYPDKAGDMFGSTGHSQGGQAAFIVLQFAEEKFGPMAKYAGLAIEPASGFGSQPAGGTWQSIYGMIKSPMFMFSGTADALVSRGWVSRGFAALDDSIEAYHWSAVGATHVPVPNAETIEVGVPWFRWKLLGDNAACTAFKGLIGSNWTVVEEQNPVACN